MRRLALALLPLTACDVGSLVSTDRVYALGELGGIPEDPAWDLRWFRGYGEGLASGCPLVPADDIDPSGNDANNISDGTLYVEPPAPPEPEFWISGEGGSYRWAVAFVVLVDRQAYEPPATLEMDGGELIFLPDEDPESDDWEPWLGEGAWGAAEDAALLYVEGDTSQFVLHELDLDDDLELVIDEPVWVGVLPELLDLTGSLSRALYPIDQQQEEEGLRLRAEGFLSEAGLWAVSGAPLGGLTEACQ